VGIWSVMIALLFCSCTGTVGDRKGLPRTDWGSQLNSNARCSERKTLCGHGNGDGSLIMRFSSYVWGFDGEIRERVRMAQKEVYWHGGTRPRTEMQKAVLDSIRMAGIGKRRFLTKNRPLDPR